MADHDAQPADRPPAPPSAGAPPIATSVGQLVRRRSPMLFLLATTAGAVAVGAQVTALGVQVFALTGRELDLGLLGLAEFAPALFLAVPAGTLADRADRRLLAGIGLGGEAVCSLAIALVTLSGHATFGTLVALVIAFGVCRGFTAPSHRALPATLVAPAELPRIVPLFSGSWQFGTIVGPVVGGFLYALDPAAPYVASAVLLAAAASLLPFVRLHPSARAPEEPAAVARRAAADDRGLRAAFDGFRVIRRNPILLGAISLDLFAVLFGGAVALLPALADERLGVGSIGLGWLRAAAGIGAALTTLLIALRPVRRHIGRVLLGVVGVFGVATLVLGATSTYAVALVSLVVLGSSDAVSVFIRSSLVPLVTADEYRGRVLAVENVFIGASNELGAFESGVVGQLLGASGAVVLGGAATLVVVVAWWFGFPALRDVDRFSDVTDPANLGGSGGDGLADVAPKEER